MYFGGNFTIFNWHVSFQIVYFYERGEIKYGGILRQTVTESSMKDGME